MITLFGPPEKSQSFLDRLKNSVSKTRTELSARFEQLLTGDLAGKGDTAFAAMHVNADGQVTEVRIGIYAP